MGSILADGGLMSVIMYHLKHSYHLSDKKIGWIMMSTGLGAFLATLFPSRYKFVRGKSLLLGIIVTAIGTI